MRARSDDACLRRYLDGLATSTRDNRKPLLENFFESVDLSPSQAVRFQRENASSYKLLESAYKWIEGDGGLRVSSMRMRLGSIRGFFQANRAPLPREKHRFHSVREPVVGELTVDEFRQILSSCNIVYRCAFLVQFQSGSGVKELHYINTRRARQIWDDVLNGKQIIRLNMPGRKANFNIQPYYTFLGSDAVACLKQLFESMAWRRDNVLFRNQYGKPISTVSFQWYFRNQATKLGLIKRKTPRCLDCQGETVKKIVNKKAYYICIACKSEHSAQEHDISHNVSGGIRYRMKTHELRDLFRTEWARAVRYYGVDPHLAEFMMGHSIDALEYNKIMRDWKEAQVQYRRAMPMLNILSEDPRKVERSEIEDRLEAKESHIEVLEKRMNEMQRQVTAFGKLCDALTDERKLKRFEKLLNE